MIVEVVVVTVIVLALLGVIGVLAFGGSSHSRAATGSTKAQTATSTAAVPTSTVATATTTVPTRPAPTTALDPVSAARSSDSAGYTYMQRLETMLQRANNGRSEIGPLIAAVQDNCSRDPNDAIVAVDSVVGNRQSLLNEIASTTVDPSSSQADLTTKFQRAMSTSIEADRAYARWLQNVLDYYYRPPEGCYGTPPQDSNWNDAQQAESQVTPAKRAFVDAYDTQASRFGMKTWSVDDI